MVGKSPIHHHRSRITVEPFLSYQSARRLLALGVVGVHGLARALGAALGAIEASATALGPLSSAASSGSRSGSRSGLGGESGGSRSSRGVVGRGGRGRTSAGGSSTSLPDGRTGHGESLAAVVDAEVGVWVRGLVGTGELDSGTGGTAAATLNLDLHARDVVLGLVDVGAVNTNVLEAGEVLSVGSVLGDPGRNVIPVVIAPGGRGEIAAIADTLLVDLEPGAVLSVKGLDTAGGLGHVDKFGTGVLELGADSELEADLVTSLDGQDIGLAGRGESTLVADDIGTIDMGVVADVGRGVGGELDGVVLGSTSRLANVLEGRRLDSTDNGLVHEVVSGSHLGDGGDKSSGELHSELAVTNVLDGWLKRR